MLQLNIDDKSLAVNSYYSYILIFTYFNVLVFDEIHKLLNKK